MAHRVSQPAPIPILTPARPPSRVTSSTALWLSCILAGGLVLRLGLLPFRWVNPDEGAHLMDGRLILHGLVPLVDFASRQPLYAYVQAGMLAAFHGSYLAARLLPVAAIMGTAFVVFLIARRLFNAPIALLATAIYVFHPLVVIWSPIVKTEPLTAFLSSMGIYFTVRFSQSDDRWWFLVLAGAMLGLAYYVRQSSLAVALAVAVFLLVELRRHPGQLARALSALAAGGLCIVALAIAYYARYMTPAQLWGSNLNPLRLIIGAADKLAPIAVTGAAGTGSDALRLDMQSWAATIAAVRETLAVNASLFAGLVASLGIAVYLRVSRPVELRRYAYPLVLLTCWACALMLAYAYWAVHRGYFTQYFGETVPPLAILLAFALWYLSGILASASTGITPALALGVGLATVFVAYRVRPTLDVPNLIVVVVPALLVGLVYLDAAQRKRWGGILAVAAAAIVVGGAAGSFVSQHLVTLAKALIAILALVVIAVIGRSRTVERGAYIALALIVTTCVTAFAASGRVMGLAYQCIWSPRTVADVARYIQMHSSSDAQVMSGAVIWAVAADRPPFMMIAHPLAFDRGAPPDTAARMRAYLDSAPPRLIVLDGYTNRTFLSYLDPDGKLLATRYKLDKVFSGSRYPVKVYELKSATPFRAPCCSTSSE